MKIKTLKTIAAVMRRQPENSDMSLAECMQVLRDKNGFPADLHPNTCLVEHEDGSLEIAR